MSKYNKGKYFEELAYKYLIKKGYKIIHRNIYSRFGEIDILCIKDNKFNYSRSKRRKIQIRKYK